MKLVFRVFALSIVVAGAAAAAVAPKTAPMVPSHQSATAKMPIPWCGTHPCPSGN